MWRGCARALAAQIAFPLIKKVPIVLGRSFPDPIKLKRGFQTTEILAYKIAYLLSRISGVGSWKARISQARILVFRAKPLHANHFVSWDFHLVHQHCTIAIASDLGVDKAKLLVGGQRGAELRAEEILGFSG